jgi:hypothetical protein
MTTEGSSGSHTCRDCFDYDEQPYDEKLWIAWPWIIGLMTLIALTAAILA